MGLPEKYPDSGEHVRVLDLLRGLERSLQEGLCILQTLDPDVNVRQ